MQPRDQRRRPKTKDADQRPESLFHAESVQNGDDQLCTVDQNSPQRWLVEACVDQNQATAIWATPSGSQPASKALPLIAPRSTSIPTCRDIYLGLFAPIKALSQVPPPPADTRICRHLSSETLEIVASGEKRFFVHSDILAAHSGPLKETTEAARDRAEQAGRKINLQEWDGDTVGRFVEFLYVGHYQAPSPTRQPSVAAPDPAASDDDDTYQRSVDTPGTSYSVWTGTVQSDTTETGPGWTASPPGPRPLTPLSQFGLKLESDPNPNMRQEALEKFGLRAFHPAVCSYGAVLLAHAKVYSLAQNQEVEALRDFSYKHLLSVLLGIGPIEPGWRVVVDIINLLRYVYSHTVPAEDAEEPLQNIVSQFAALNFPALQNRDEMAELIREGGKLASDLMDKVCKRLVHSESLLQEAPGHGTEAQEAIQEDTEWGATSRTNTNTQKLRPSSLSQTGRDTPRPTAVDFTRLLVEVSQMLDQKVYVGNEPFPLWQVCAVPVSLGLLACLVGGLCIG